MKIYYPPIVSYSMLPQSPQAYMNEFANNGHECYFADSNHPAAEQKTTEPFSPRKNLTVLPTYYDIGEIDPDLLFFSFPPHLQYIDRHNFSYVLFVMYDYHGENHIPQLKECIKKADIVVAISRKLYNLALKLGANEENLLYVPNGVYNDRFKGKFRVPDQLNEIDGRLFGYSGVLSHEWIDVPSIKHIAKQCPDDYVVITGSSFDVDMKSFPKNVINCGHINEKEFPNFIRSFDVGLIPFNYNKFAEHMYPLKFNEYLAAGLPVVSSPIPAVEDSWLAYIAKNPMEYIDRIDTALQEDNKNRKKTRQNFADKMEWGTVLKSLINRIGEFN